MGIPLPYRNPRSTFRNPEVRSWAIALLLMLPAAIPYATHFLVWKRYSLPTGYIQPDMPIYMAKAREYFDSGAVHLTYSNPCSPSYDEPRLYFQPWTFALGLVHRLSGLGPRWVFVGFWFVAAWGAARAALELYREVVGRRSWGGSRALVVFFWGGGVLALAGAFWALLTSGTVSSRDLFALDPADGWWFLNFGRNLIYPTEAFYHALVFGGFVLVLRRRFVLAFLVAALTAASSPFAGLESLAILGTWAVVESLAATGGDRPLGFLAAIAALTLAFFAYYLGFLNLEPGHRVTAAQMSLPWGYRLENYVPAYGLVAALAVMAIRRRSLGAFLGSTRNRFLMTWFVVAFALTKHDLILAPRQPIHFTRGYVWTPLFLMGARTLATRFDLWRRRFPRGRLAVAAVVLVLVADNAAWFGRHVVNHRAPEANGLRISADQEAVLRRLDDSDLQGSTILTDDRLIGYLALAETRLRSWISHWLESPHFFERRDQLDALFAEGRFRDDWESLRLLVITTRHADRDGIPPWLADRGASCLFENRRYRIFRLEPIPAPKIADASIRANPKPLSARPRR